MAVLGRDVLNPLNWGETLTLPARQTLRHLAVIPDGNRRWARARGLPIVEGHARGFLIAARRAIARAFERDIETFTLWMFSEDNWERERAEIDNLMGIYGAFFDNLADVAPKTPFTVSVIGRRDRIPDLLKNKVDAAVARTQDRESGSRRLLLCLDYSGGRSVFDAVRNLLRQGADGSEIRDTDILRALNGHGEDLPPIDLVVRTAGERRLSGFMPLQSAGAELLFLEKCFPDLDKDDIDNAIADFRSRHLKGGK